MGRKRVEPVEIDSLIFSQYSIDKKKIQRWGVYVGEELIAEVSFPTGKGGKFLVPQLDDRSFELSELEEIVNFMKLIEKNAETKCEDCGEPTPTPPVCWKCRQKRWEDGHKK